MIQVMKRAEAARIKSDHDSPSKTVRDSHQIDSAKCKGPTGADGRVCAGEVDAAAALSILLVWSQVPSTLGRELTRCSSWERSLHLSAKVEEAGLN